MRELEYIMNIFISALSKEGALSSDTVFGHIAKYIDFQYFHNTKDRYNIVQNSLNMLNIDHRFNSTLFRATADATFASDASFLRGMY